MNLKGFSDNNLLMECGKDNLKAFNILFERYSSKLYHYALRYLHDEHLAEETMMDLMLWVWEKRHTLKVEGEFQAYVFRAIKNATIKAIRKKPLYHDQVELYENNATLIALSTDYRLNEKELKLVYEHKLNLLSPQRKQVFRLSREEQLSHSEIADSMNLSVFTVKNHIKASLAHFRKHLKGIVEITTILILIVGYCL